MICCRGMIITGPGVIAPAGRFLPSAALALTAGVLAGEAGADVCCSTWRSLKTAKDWGGVNITEVLGPAVAGLNSNDVNSEVDTGLMSGEEGILFEEGRSAVVGTAESMTDNDPGPPLTLFFSSAVLLPLSRSSS